MTTALANKHGSTVNKERLQERLRDRTVNSRFLHKYRWRSGVVASALASINEVNQRRARLVLRWATVSGFNSRCMTFIPAYNQPSRSTQPGHPFVGKRNEYQLKGGDALRLGVQIKNGSCVGGRWNCVISCYTRTMSKLYHSCPAWQLVLSCTLSYCVIVAAVCLRLLLLLLDCGICRFNPIQSNPIHAVQHLHT